MDFSAAFFSFHSSYVIFMASWSRAAQLLPLGILPPFTDEVPSYPDYASKKSELADDYAEYRDFR